MAAIQTFEDLLSWQEARALVREVYALTASRAFQRDDGLRRQFQRAAVSTMANVAEGFERKATREFVSFLGIARASAGEVRSHLYVALDLQMVSQETFDAVAARTRTLISLIDGMIRYLKTVDHRGHRYAPYAPPSNINP